MDILIVDDIVRVGDGLVVGKGVFVGDRLFVEDEVTVEVCEKEQVVVGECEIVGVTDDVIDIVDDGVGNAVRVGVCVEVKVDVWVWEKEMDGVGVFVGVLVEKVGDADSVYDLVFVIDTNWVLVAVTDREAVAVGIGEGNSDSIWRNLFWKDVCKLYSFLWFCNIIFLVNINTH